MKTLDMFHEEKHISGATSIRFKSRWYNGAICYALGSNIAKLSNSV